MGGEGLGTTRSLCVCVGIGQVRSGQVRENAVASGL